MSRSYFTMNKRALHYFNKDVDLYSEDSYNVSTLINDRFLSLKGLFVSNNGEPIFLPATAGRIFLLTSGDLTLPALAFVSRSHLYNRNETMC